MGIVELFSGAMGQQKWKKILQAEILDAFARYSGIIAAGLPSTQRSYQV